MFNQTPIFQQLKDYPSVHCATLIELEDGTLLSAWFGGAYEMSPDVVLLSSRLEINQTQWSPPEVIAVVDGKSLGQPVFLERANGELWLFFNVIEENHWTSAQPHLQRSLDKGRTWQTPIQLMDYRGLMFRSRPFILPNRIIMPVYDENTWQSRMMISDDDGNTWRLTAPMTTPNGNIHPCVVQLSDGRLLAYLRTGGQGSVIWRSESHDKGDTWSDPTQTSLPNPNSGIDLLRLQSGNLVVAFNDSDTKRTPLCVAIASENEDWQKHKILENDPAEFSYPTLIQGKDGQIHIVYTYRRKHIQYACFTESWLETEN